MLKEILKAIKEAATINAMMFIFGFMIIAAMGYSQDGEILGTITCTCGAITAILAIWNETEKVEALCYNKKEETEDSELD